MKKFTTRVETGLNSTVIKKSEACFKLMEYTVYIKNSFGFKTLKSLYDECMEVNPIHQEFGFVFDIFFDKFRVCANVIDDTYFIDLEFDDCEIQLVSDVIKATEEYQWV